MLSWKNSCSLATLILLSWTQNLAEGIILGENSDTGPFKAGEPIMTKLEVRKAFGAKETGYNSCEMCLDYDGHGQCITITEGRSKQSICLPYYAREEGCSSDLCGAGANCYEEKLDEESGNGIKFDCRMLKPDKKDAEYTKFYNEEECESCQNSTDTTGGCLLINNLYACILPSFFPEAAEKATCNSQLCPKYSKCSALKKKGKTREYFLLQCLFDPALLPNPPSDEEVSKSLAVTGKILEEVTVKNNQLANITSVKVGDKERDEIRQTIDKTCSDQTKTKVVVDKPAEEPRPQVFFRVRRKRDATAPPQPITNAQDTLSCVIQEIVIAEGAESDHFSQVLEMCESGKKAKNATKRQLKTTQTTQTTQATQATQATQETTQATQDNSEWTPPPECIGDEDSEPDRRLLCKILTRKNNENKSIRRNSGILKEVCNCRKKRV